jgi:quercetin dioxygenase-like cupin family protein
MRNCDECYPPAEEEIFMVKKLIRAASYLALPLLVFGVMRSQQAVQQTQRIPQFENENVKVWKSVVLPHSPLTMHHHDHPRVIIALKGGTMNLVNQNGPTESHVWETGKAYWLSTNAPGTMHADVNAGDQPIEVMVVELEKEK